MAREYGPDFRDGRPFGLGTFIGNNKGADTFFRKPRADQVVELGWSNGCPNTEAVVKRHGLDRMIPRYGETNFWLGYICQLAWTINLALYAQLVQASPRLANEPVGEHEPQSVPRLHLDQIYPMSSLCGYALPRVLIEQIGRGSDRSQARLVTALAILESTIAVSTTPGNLLARLSEKAILAGVHPTAVLSHVPSAGILKEENCQTALRALVTDLQTHAPVLFTLLSYTARASIGKLAQTNGRTRISRPSQPLRLCATVIDMISSYWLIFLTGLTAGGFSCLALQGGLLATTLANTSTEEKSPSRLAAVVPTLAFLLTKLGVYTLLGALLGYFGSVFTLSGSARITFQIIAAVLMLGLAANMLGLHPVFRHFVIQPPKWVGKVLRQHSRSNSWFAPAVVGLFTVLIPCAVTQSMEVLAISSGNAAAGAAIMASFTLGTVPVFLALGWVTTRLSELARKRFFRFSAALVILIAISSLNGALVLAGSNYSLNNWVWAFKQVFLANNSQPATQNLTITASRTGYSPGNLTVKSGQPVTLTIQTTNNYSCTSTFIIPKLGITQALLPTGSTQVSFTPDKPGPLAFTCGMGMYTGTINVQ